MRKMLLFLYCVSAYTYVFAQKDCRHIEYENKIVADNPQIAARLASIEAFTYSHTGGRQVVLSGEIGSFTLPTVITIPVVVHILYNSENQNLSDKLIQSQIDALNKDFRNLNDDRTRIPSWFANLAADCGIEFKLAGTDPHGYTTNGIVRIKTGIQSFGTDDRAKFAARGGNDAWDAGKYLNIWVCNLAGGIMGYSSLLGGPVETDGVVIHTTVFGVNGNNQGAFNRGRTTTHEIGHWLNLRHIWGDASCGDDKVDDTPSQRSPNRGCPSGQRTSCGTTPFGDLYMNYMDLTNDECMYMFTNGQRERMRSLFLKGGPRNSLLSSNGLAGSALPQPGALSADDNSAVAGTSLNIYPNPASNTLTVALDAGEMQAGRSFVIYNHLGQPVQQCTIKGKTNTVDITHLISGIYFLKSMDGGSKKTSRFIKIN